LIKVKFHSAAEPEIRNTNIEIRNKLESQNQENSNGPSCGRSFFFGFRICFGFRYSIFGLLPLTWMPSKLGKMCTRHAALAVAVTLLSMAPAGCGGPKHEFAEVTGKVTLDDQPLPGVMVRFYPLSDAAEQLPYATAMTDDAGVYRLTSQTGEPGALVGRNRVVVHWPSRDLLEAEGRRPPTASQRIPLRYTVAADSPLEFEVKGGGPQTFDLPLQQ
jgi:hypothetical protein